MMQWVFIFVGLSSIVGSILLGGSEPFLDLSSAVLVLVAGCGFAIAAHGMSAIRAAIAAALRNSPIEDADSDFHVIVLQTLRNSLCAAGAVGFLIGLVAMLARLSDPTQVGPAMAVAALTAFYALVLSEMIVAPMIHRLRVRSEVRAESEPISAPRLEG